MHYRPDQKKNCHSREGGNPRIYGGERKVQLIMFTYLGSEYAALTYGLSVSALPTNPPPKKANNWKAGIKKSSSLLSPRQCDRPVGGDDDFL